MKQKELNDFSIQDLIDKIQDEKITKDLFKKYTIELSKRKYEFFNEEELEKIYNYFLNILEQHNVKKEEIRNKSIFDLEYMVSNQTNIRSFKIKRNYNVKQLLKKKKTIIWNFGNIFVNEIQVLYKKEEKNFYIYSPFYNFNIVLNEKNTILFLRYYLLQRFGKIENLY